MRMQSDAMATPEATQDTHKAFEEVVSRLGAFGIEADDVEMDNRGRVSLAPEHMLRVLEFEAHTGFRSPFALGRALDTRREYKHMGVLAIRLDLTGLCDISQPEHVDRVLRQLSANVRELDACYRCVDTTLVMLLPETGTRDRIIGAARRIRMALCRMGISAAFGGSATKMREGALGHEYMGAALVALAESQSLPERIAFCEV